MNQHVAYEDPSDRDPETVRRLLERDPEGLRRLLEDHGARARLCLYREFPSLSELDVDGALNFGAMRVWESVRSFDPDRGTLRAWFYVIVRNAAVGILRREAKEGKHREAADPELVSGASTLDEARDSSERQQAFVADLRGCITGLTPTQRAIIEADLRNGDVADGDELASELKTTKNSIYASRSMARKTLRNCMLSKGHAFSNTSSPNC